MSRLTCVKRTSNRDFAETCMLTDVLDVPGLPRPMPESLYWGNFTQEHNDIVQRKLKEMVSELEDLYTKKSSAREEIDTSTCSTKDRLRASSLMKQMYDIRARIKEYTTDSCEAIVTNKQDEVSPLHWSVLEKLVKYNDSKGRKLDDDIRPNRDLSDDEYGDSLFYRSFVKDNPGIIDIINTLGRLGSSICVGDGTTDVFAKFIVMRCREEGFEIDLEDKQGYITRIGKFIDELRSLCSVYQDLVDGLSVLDLTRDFPLPRISLILDKVRKSEYKSSTEKLHRAIETGDPYGYNFPYKKNNERERNS